MLFKPESDSYQIWLHTLKTLLQGVGNRNSKSDSGYVPENGTCIIK